MRNIFEYIAFQLMSITNADKQITRIEKAIYKLDQMPERFKKYEEEPWHSLGMRVMPVDNYIVFYIPNIDKKVIDIVRIIYSGRDISNQFQLMVQEG